MLPLQHLFTEWLQWTVRIFLRLLPPFWSAEQQSDQHGQVATMGCTPATACGGLHRCWGWVCVCRWGLILWSWARTLCSSLRECPMGARWARTAPVSLARVWSATRLCSLQWYQDFKIECVRCAFLFLHYWGAKPPGGSRLRIFWQLAKGERIFLDLIYF